MTVTDPPLPVFDGPGLAALVSADDAVGALRTALLDGLDPAAAQPRSQVPVSAGHLLLMPAEHAGFAGVKVAGVAPDNPGRGLPRITGVYLLLDAATLRPLAILDGQALTLRRTSAVSALAVDALAVPDAGRLLLYGTGPQALAHAEAFARVRRLRQVEVSGTRPERVEALVARARAAGLPASVAGPDAVREADIVACCTSADEPLFDGGQLAAHATVVAMGSHTPEAREVDTRTVTRATPVVEDTATALREAGDIMTPVAEGALDPAALVTLADVVRGTAPVDFSRPRLFKSTGMAWQDLVVAACAYRAASARKDGSA
ncbi:ornithine cyclodeaminase [Streptomyces sp. 150FB]|uniref:ornithine cyclodeaminase family protein n=1 Tax=Streptomyces sp. 150FB TaxID=1576605 RepID=UPI0005891CCD|nr:ornithine cyclodeaminase family protein [Streptomyces sp. 150FB]KIF73631.1 ornithine cyclodeaminase [Streptomyces sp. 150FB]